MIQSEMGWEGEMAFISYLLLEPWYIQRLTFALLRNIETRLGYIDTINLNIFWKCAGLPAALLVRAARQAHPGDFVENGKLFF